ncbi:hypothetical protein [Pedococcus sp. 2YAF34]|uniref:hypothetical protein n=1 Tax=Pedococcus sp. 2YAF34 TaxID=3233032 RepID=UPI003F988C3A
MKRPRLRRSSATRRWTVHRCPAPALLAATVLVLAGCVGQGNVENHNAGSAALAFASSAKASPATACDLLAPETRKELESTDGPCDSSLPLQVGPAGGIVRQVQVYGKDAIVHLSTDTVFLARFRDGWRVTAAACTSRGDRPYDCKIKGD